MGASDDFRQWKKGAWLGVMDNTYGFLCMIGLGSTGPLYGLARHHARLPIKIAHFVSRYGLVLTVFALAACGKPGSSSDVPLSPIVDAEGRFVPVHYSYEIVHEWPHDPGAFTQGLVFREGEFLESTGLNGRSSLRNVDIKSGRVLKKKTLSAEYFGEGLAVIGPRAYLLTWKSQKGFIYDADTFEQQGEFAYEGEGWGLTTDGKMLIMSDGTDRIRFIDPKSSAVVRTIKVVSSGQPLDRLNELEWIKGEIFANVWRTDTVVRIDPMTGVVRGIIDFSHLLPPEDRRPETDILNGIAYDPEYDRLFVTGKCWPKVFEVRLKPQAR